MKINKVIILDLCIIQNTIGSGTLVPPSASQHSPLIRIACRELEAWYFGDLDAVQQAFPDFIAARYRNKSKFRNPDSIVNPGYELGKIVPNFTKGYAAREVSKYMNIDNNTSASFKHTIASIRNLVEAPK